MPEVNDGFYVGYQARAAAVVRRHIGRSVIALVIAAAIVAIGLTVGQPRFAASLFEYGHTRDFAGELIEWPYPMLITTDSAYLLVGEGKFGVGREAAGHDGERVQLKGTLIERGANHAIEVARGSFRFLPNRYHVNPEPVVLGAVKLTGEIVDTKCHLGVMNPGEGKVHRDCAVRCISGGAPPGFLVRDGDGETRLLLLTGRDGRALGREVLDYVAEPIAISGELARQGTALILKAEPRDFRRE